MKKQMIALLLVLVMLVSVIPVPASAAPGTEQPVGPNTAIRSELSTQAIDLSGLSCDSFIANEEHREYINMMMRHYISSDSKLQTALKDGLSVVFMFEGGSDNYPGNAYERTLADIRNQAVVIVVQNDADGKAKIVTRHETCSSLPGDPKHAIQIDGTYSIYTWNHQRYSEKTYGALQIDQEGKARCLYAPDHDKNGYFGVGSGMNIHTRSSTKAGGTRSNGSTWYWSEGCQLIGTGNTSSNYFNTFMRVVAGIDYDVWINYSGSQFNGITDYQDVGYYVIDRQLAKSGLGALYNSTALGKITAASDAARRAAESNHPATITFNANGGTGSMSDQTVTYGDTLTLPANTFTRSGYVFAGWNAKRSDGTWFVKKQGWLTESEISSGGYSKHLYTDGWSGSFDDSWTSGGSGYSFTFYAQWTPLYNTYLHLNYSGKNYLVESDFSNGLNSTHWGSRDTSVSEMFVDTDQTHNGYNALKIVNYAVGSSGKDMFFETLTNSRAANGCFADSKEMVLSFWAKASKNGTGIHLRWGYEGADEYRCIPLSTEWEYYTLRMDKDTGDGSSIHPYIDAVGTVWLAELQLEDGTVATEFAAESESVCETMSLTEGAAYELPEDLVRDGYTFDGWYTAKDGGTQFANAGTADAGHRYLYARWIKNGCQHNYSAQVVEATCIELGYTVYTCSICGDTYIVYNGEYSEWSAQKPEGTDDSLIETKTQYRYSDYETTTSYDTALTGWNRIGSSWQQEESGSISYVKSWPSGFLTSHSLYSTYNKAAKSASETETDKTVINSDKVSGYLYYHWCRGTYTAGPINRGSKSTKQGEFTAFHAFYSTTNPGTLEADGDGSVIYSNGSCCKDSYWYFYTPVNTQNYATYRNLFTYERWTEWTEWSDTVYTATDTRKVDTRTLYRVITGELGDHEWDDGVVITEPGCTSCGTKKYACIHCGQTEETVYGEPLGHDMGGWFTVAKATCTENGTEQRDCSRCDHYETRIVEAVGHTYESVVIAPTCTEQGYTTHTCNCGDHYVDTYVDALGHDWDDGVVTIEPTEDSVGEMTYTCERCGKTRTESIPKLEHEHRYDAVVTAPTCTGQGYTTYACECGESYIADYVEALGHDMGGWMTVTAATCTETGEEQRHCSRCDYNERRTIDATGHSFGNWVMVQEPTTSEEGIEERVCDRCGYTEQRSAAKRENPFSDVAPGSFYYDPVMWAIENGITNGTSATTFGPDNKCMRAHVVTFLWRAVGCPEPTGTNNPFVDVKASDFYYKPVLWALENGITSGMDATHFGPTSYCNRAQVVTFLYRTMENPEVMTCDNPFTDVPDGQWFTTPILWAVQNGITNGLSATTFGPNSICNRAQIVTFLYRAFN